VPTLFVDDEDHGFTLHVSENLMALYTSKLSLDFNDFLRPEQFGVTSEPASCTRTQEIRMGV